MAKRMAIISLHGSLDAAYPPLIIATAAAAMDMEVTIFFTFYGLEILKKGNADKLQVLRLLTQPCLNRYLGFQYRTSLAFCLV
jgi:peroxiredoxin family protein